MFSGCYMENLFCINRKWGSKNLLSILWSHGPQPCLTQWNYEPCHVGPPKTGHGGEFWQNVVHWRREWQTTSVVLPWEPREQYEQYDKPRQRIKKQSHQFADKGLCSQSYGFSSSHVWMWELDHKEGWALKNWCSWTVVLEKTLPR